LNFEELERDMKKLQTDPRRKNSCINASTPRRAYGRYPPFTTWNALRV